MRSDGTTALHWAAQRGHAACIQALLANGADVNVVDRCVNFTSHSIAYSHRCHVCVVYFAVTTLIFITELEKLPCTMLLSDFPLPSIWALNPYQLPNFWISGLISKQMRLVASIDLSHACTSLLRRGQTSTFVTGVQCARAAPNASSLIFGAVKGRHLFCVHAKS